MSTSFSNAFGGPSGGAPTSTAPFMLAIKNATVLTTGTPADVATVTLPSWCTRYIVGAAGSRLVAESASGTLAGATFTIRSVAAGAGTSLISNALGPASTSVSVAVTGGGGTGLPFTENTLYLHQSTNSANAGVVSMYLLITPLL